MGDQTAKAMGHREAKWWKASRFYVVVSRVGVFEIQAVQTDLEVDVLA